MSSSGNTETVPTESREIIATIGEESERHRNRIHGALRRIIRAVEIDSKRLSSRYNITGPQLVTLRSVVERGPLTSTEISKTVYLSPSTIVGILDRLQARKLIRRRRDDHDRRQIMVKATAAGERLAGELSDPQLFGLSAAIDNLPQFERDSLTRALENIVVQLDSHHENGES